MEQRKTIIAERRLRESDQLDNAGLAGGRLASIVNSVKNLFPGTKRSENNSIPKYQDRPIIGRDRPIDGGVYLGDTAREALVVDMKNSPALLGICEKVKQNAWDGNTYDNSKILMPAFREVAGIITIKNPDIVEQIIAERGWLGDRKVSLENFYREGFGVCRHMALGLGAVLESFIKDGILSGNVSVDRSMGTYKGREGGHAWVRYTNSAGEVLILDPMLNYAGTLVNAMQKRQSSDHIWNYAREEDLSKLNIEF